jgi:putative transposase
MPRAPRPRLADVPFHVVQRGNNRAPCFFCDGDRRRYLEGLRRHGLQHGVATHAYVLMTNHVHLLVTPREPDALGAFMKFVGQLYAQYVNRRYGRSGSLWDGRFHSRLIDNESYLLQCHRYIECNPVRAGMARHPGAYPWSSYRANALGAPDPMVTPHPLIRALGRTAEESRSAYRDLFLRELQPDFVEHIRGDRRRPKLNGGV